MESVLLLDDWTANCITCVSQVAKLLRAADSGIDIVTGVGREFVETASCEDTGEVVNVVRNGDDSVSKGTFVWTGSGSRSLRILEITLVWAGSAVGSVIRPTLR